VGYARVSPIIELKPSS